MELLGPNAEDPIDHALELRLRGSGFVSREAAIDAGKLWRDRVTVAFAHYEKGIEIGLDVSTDEPSWGYGQPYFIFQRGRVNRDTPQLTVFPTNNEPPSSVAGGEGVVAHPVQTFINGPLGWVKRRDCHLRDQQRLAYKLFHATHFDSNPESKYILLFTGIEALIPKRFRVEPIRKMLRQLRTYLETLNDTQESPKESVRRLLTYKENESIRYRGRNWVQLLDDCTFDAMTAEDYFLRAYDTRNSLAHGNVDRPTPESLNTQIPELRRYLLALLDMDVFGELMPGLMAYNQDGSIIPEAAP